MIVPVELFRSTLPPVSAAGPGAESLEIVSLHDPTVRLLDALERSLHGEIGPDEIIALLKEWGR